MEQLSKSMHARSRNLDQVNEMEWKSAFYVAYESGDHTAATSILERKRPAMLYYYGLEWNYRQMKKYDRTFQQTSMAVWITYITLILWVISCTTKTNPLFLF